MSDPEFNERHMALKALQSRRLHETYRDFSEQRMYRTTCDYFFGEVYNTDDTEARDEAFRRFTDHISKVLGGDIVRCLKRMIRLQTLTLQLDKACTHALLELDAPVDFDMALYERAYREMGRFSEREEQIALTLECLTLAHKIFRRFGIGAGLFALHEFQRVRGDDLITGFLWRGYQAIHKLRRIDPLALAVREREEARLARIFADG
ncbi:FFLEELY motif protein [Acanthopleuribacter pedis]|uniref:DUF8198 domain-containing protein n=1 Tax=Acanthopleuribacter pedis TaxID=442870 RepID=A0A8J7U6N6_9BACT|nr:hypothetical protein [Acanthopleuribacter pedis]MBO1321628.1 hypothetical protein [Acanthopleuribacter pedis]